MRHLIICREYPPTVQPPGGIGTYVHRLARLLAESGAAVHVVAERLAVAPASLPARRWAAARAHTQRSSTGR